MRMRHPCLSLGTRRDPGLHAIRRSWADMASSSDEDVERRARTPGTGRVHFAEGPSESDLGLSSLSWDDWCFGDFEETHMTKVAENFADDTDQFTSKEECRASRDICTSTSSTNREIASSSKKIHPEDFYAFFNALSNRTNSVGIVYGVSVWEYYNIYTSATLLLNRVWKSDLNLPIRVRRSETKG